MQSDKVVEKSQSDLNAIVAWKGALESKSFRIQFIFFAILLSTFSFIFTWFFDFVEARNGIQIHDFVLNTVPAYNVSWGVFFVLYSAIAVGMVTHRAHPNIVLTIVQTYILITFVRMISITLVPLEPPFGYIPLREPIVQFFTNGGRIISKDLFFSGHMTTVLSLYYGTQNKNAKKYLLTCVFAMACLLIVQHVHYTIDVLFAIPFTYLVYQFCKRYLGGN